MPAKVLPITLTPFDENHEYERELERIEEEIAATDMGGKYAAATTSVEDAEVREEPHGHSCHRMSSNGIADANGVGGQGKAKEEISPRRTHDAVSSFFRDMSTPSGFISANSRFQESWDMVGIALLFYVMLVTPFEVCFLGAQPVDSALFWINRIVDFLFLIDSICQFYVIPSDMNTNTLSSAQIRSQLRYRYLTGWFVVDVLSLLPYDFIAWAIQKGFPDGDLSMLRLLRVIRLLRLGKVLRVLRTSSIVARYDDRHGINFTKFRIAKYLFIVLIAAHWSACFLRLVPLVEGNETNNWVYVYFGRDDVNAWEVYNVAIYYAIMTITSVGYGDVMAQSAPEICAATVVMAVGAFVVVFLLGSVTSMLNAINLQQQEYFKLRDQLDEFTVSAEIPPELCYKLRHYFRSQFESGALYDWSLVLNRMSNQLKDEIAAILQKQWINNCVYFREAPTEALAAVASIIVQRSFVNGEALIVLGESATTLFVVKKGLVVSDGTLCGAGKMVGEDMLMNCIRKALELKQVPQRHETPSGIRGHDEHFVKPKVTRKVDVEKREYAAIAMGYTQANQMEQASLVRVLSSSPDLLEAMKKQVAREAFKIHTMSYAKAYVRVHGTEAPDGTGHVNIKTGGYHESLVSWYERKLRMSLKYNSDERLKQIVLLQRNIRCFIQRARFRQICASISKDPHMMYIKMQSSLRRIESKLDCGTPELSGAELGSQHGGMHSVKEELDKEMKKLRVYYDDAKAAPHPVALQHLRMQGAYINQLHLKLHIPHFDVESLVATLPSEM